MSKKSQGRKHAALRLKPLPENFGIRCMDVLGACLGLLLSLPLLLTIPLLIKLDSAGPVLYKQRRTGRDRRGAMRPAFTREKRTKELFGRTFFIYKFRTMRHEAERRTGPIWAMPEDPRITKVGQWLRKFHLDEIPQFWNVLKGEMSLVGPRPERPEIIAQLVEEVPEYRLRLLIKPGMTGLAQICQGYDGSIADVKRKTRLDVFYATHFSARLYLRILFMTLVKIFSASPVLETEHVIPGLDLSAWQQQGTGS